ncbi:pantetheine-phosphate adenylyltransferase [Salinispira pacifica]|uniref:Phosphopantetheine adenylyltransferase n=1 Tax=Salinispira pacifica TaxID=1307761 RepID=V5WHN5_9SPIO|nr:pantetheine-phosphate adenylyltransferase [Salinispira pacifica]AHC15130.1 Phosphopantetheine adenylyltransferase [Salinispira pacifica]
MKKALFPGSFDPPTHGHLNIIHRAMEVFDEIHVVIAVNPQKNYAFTAEERFEMIKTLTEDFENVYVHLWDRLIVDFADKIGAKVLLRGVRALADFNYEFELSMMNKGLNSRVETLFMPTDPQYFVLRSSAIRELVRLGGDITSMVPGPIINQVTERFSG